MNMRDFYKCATQSAAEPPRARRRRRKGKPREELAVERRRNLAEGRVKPKISALPARRNRSGLAFTEELGDDSGESLAIRMRESTFGEMMMTKKALTGITFGLAMAALVVAGAGCSGGDTGTSGGGGVSATAGTGTGGSGTAGQRTGGTNAGGAGGASASQFQADALAICTITATLHCTNDPTVATCTTNGVDTAELAVSMNCPVNDVKAYYDCLAASPATAFQCNANGVSDVKSGTCSAQQAAINAC
jgi:hypothetical protein